MNRDIIKQAIASANVFQKGHFIFADGNHAQVKLEMDNLWNHAQELDVVLNHLADIKHLPWPDVILGVPTGGQRLAEELVKRKLVDVPLVHLERVPGGAKQDFRFVSKKDKELALAAHTVLIYEDVVSTLSSIAGVVKLLQPDVQEIHSRAIWKRGDIKKEYSQGVTDHYLVEEYIPSYLPESCPVCHEM